VEQVATMLDCSTGNVKSQSARALDKLRILLADAPVGDGPPGQRHGMNETMRASDG
jgi:hypothetical protein